MAVVARTTTTVSHTAKTDLPAVASWGIDANVPDGDTFPNGGNTLLVMNNTGGSTRVVEVVVTSTVDGLAVASRSFSIAANTVSIVKLGPTATYGTVTKVIAAHADIQLAAYAL